MRKLTSVNFENEKLIDAGCGMAFTIGLIGGRWKPSILWNLLVAGNLRFHDLRQSIPNISDHMLSRQLRELEGDGLIRKVIFREFPRKTNYELTETGISLRPALQILSEWGDRHRISI
jgi:DNA-binding HxlR family transcriptional regulator